MNSKGEVSAPIPPFKDAVAEKAKCNRAAVDLLLSDLGIADEKATRHAESLTIRRLMFSGEKVASGFENGRYTFDWNELEPGLSGILSDGVNQIGKSTILEVMIWAVRGRPRGLKAEVRAWIDTVEMEFSIGLDRYRVAFTDMDGIPRGTLVMLAPGPARTLDTFDGEDAFELVMGDLMMKRFSLQPIPNIRHDEEDPAQYFHAWSAYAASTFTKDRTLRFLATSPLVHCGGGCSICLSVFPILEPIWRFGMLSHLSVQNAMVASQPGPVALVTPMRSNGWKLLLPTSNAR